MTLLPLPIDCYTKLRTFVQCREHLRTPYHYLEAPSSWETRVRIGPITTLPTLPRALLTAVTGAMNPLAHHDGLSRTGGTGKRRAQEMLRMVL